MDHKQWKEFTLDTLGCFCYTCFSWLFTYPLTDKEGVVGQKHILVILLCLACVSLGCASRNPYVTGGIIDMQQSRYESAEVKFKQALEIEPENSDAHMWLGKSYASQRKFTKAADHFDKAISINPSQKSEFGREPRYFWAIYYNSGMDFIEDEAWDSAEKRLLSTIEIIPDSIGPYTQLSYVYTKQDKQDQAQDILNKAIEKAPDNMSVRVSLARYKIKNESYEDAKGMLKEVVSRDPDNAKAHYYLGLVFSKTKNSKEAEGEFAQAAKLDSTDRDAFFNLGFTRMALKKYGEAAEAFKRVVKFDPKDEESFFFLGMCYHEAKNYDLAIDTFTELIELNPEHGDAYIHRGYAKKEKGLTGDAYKDIEYGDKLNKQQGK
ncbi:tetratricopeptide repeat protein [candidate division TA06 bacterium]|uniref:Tetratricopeptide repeat protein n=1 Tax=candidate division TA06 bacterium TaxID=2250710 RepID=A0A523UQU9_UNCT6|nr:MAG: tetratricopeptide repeat protein [candidate division TA06 bacterium]